MKALLTRQAKTALKEIYTYYTKEVSEEVAVKIINKILDAIEELERLPGIGTIEARLEKFQLGFKFIVAGNYKIIFRIEGDTIYINDIFDGRQDPRKIEKRNK